MNPKFEYSQHNHYKWGYGDEWFNAPSSDKLFKLEFGYVTRPVMSFREECINAAKLIAAKATKPIVIGLSGGFDSQMVCLSFLQINVPFKVVIVKMFVDDSLVNGHDIKTARDFCLKYNIDYIKFDINLDEFYKTKGAEYAAKYGFSNVETIVQTATMDFVCPDYHYIMGGGDATVSPVIATKFPDKQIPTIKTHIPNQTVATWSQRSSPIMQHMVEMGYEGTSKFFLYTPELMIAYLKSDTMTNFLMAQEVIYDFWCRGFPAELSWWKCYHYLYKPFMVLTEWPEVIPVRKFTGFEHLYGPEFNTGKIREYDAIVTSYSKGVTGNQSVVLTVQELIEYVETPHTHSLLAIRVIPN